MIGADVLRDCRLYGIVDLGYVAASDVDGVATAMMVGGVDIIQLRGKQQTPDELMEIARRLHRLTREARVPLVINDHPLIARDLGAEGVHVGQDDVSVAEARQVVGNDSFVGKSTHSFEQATRAATEGADYIGFGPLFATPTKPDYSPIGLVDIARAHETVSLPIFCIGGIKQSNLPQVIAAGGCRVVIVSEMLQTADVAAYARTVKSVLRSATL